MQPDERHYRDLVTQNMLQTLQSDEPEHFRALRQSQAVLARWLCQDGHFEEAAEQYERITALDEYFIRTGGDVPALQYAVDDYLRLGRALAASRNSDPIKPYERALELAAALKEAAPEVWLSRTAAANYGIACKLWDLGRYDESLIRLALAERDDPAVFTAPSGLCPEEQEEMERCFASVAEALDVPGGRDRVLKEWEAVIRSGVLPEGDVSADELAQLAAYLDAAAAALLAVGKTRAAIGQYRKSVFWIHPAILRRRNSCEDHKRLYKALLAMAGAFEADGDKEEGALLRKLALRLNKEAPQSNNKN